MHCKYVSPSCGQKSTSNSYAYFPNNEMDKCKVSEWGVVLGVLDRVNIPCLILDTLMTLTHLKLLFIKLFCESFFILIGPFYM